MHRDTLSVELGRQSFLFEDYQRWRYQMWLKGYGESYLGIDFQVAIGALIPFEDYPSRIGESIVANTYERQQRFSGN